MTSPRIQHYSFGTITVDGEVHRKDLIIHAGGVIPNWWRKEGHSLHPDDLAEVMKLGPKQLLVGCGSPGRLTVPDVTAKWLAERGIEMLALPTSEACVLFNRLRSVGDVVLALHLTC